MKRFNPLPLILLLLVNPLVHACPFCDPEILKRQAFYEDDLVLAVYTHKPIVAAHFLIMPKRHIERFEDLTQPEVIRIYEVIKKVNQVSTTLFQTSSYLIHQKNGIEVGQSVPHIHFHYIGRKQGDASSIKFAIQMITANMHGPVSDDYMQQTVESLKKELSNENTNL